MNQGLGLLINLVEYSSRNRHCFVEMEYILDDTCLEDSLMQPSDPTQTETAAQSSETQGDGADKPKPSGALAALVKVGIVPELDIYLGCRCRDSFFLISWNVLHILFVLMISGDVESDEQMNIRRVKLSCFFLDIVHLKFLLSAQNISCTIKVLGPVNPRVCSCLKA